jgi:hypothetical protein
MSATSGPLPAISSGRSGGRARVIAGACLSALLLTACGDHGRDGRSHRAQVGAADRTSGAPDAGAGARKCFGAAARVAARGVCEDPSSVVPSLRPGELDPGTPCTRVQPLGLVVPCAFGVRPAKARASFALVGDSHAARLRSAFSVVARAQGWSGYAITRNSCAYVRVGGPLPEPYFSQCVKWKQDVPAWLARHPTVNTLFVAQLTRDAGVPPGAADPFGAQVAAYVDAWTRLPASVKHIVVIRDTPEMQPGTRTCIDAARRIRRPPGPACAVPRQIALQPDPAFAAAEQLRSPRIETIDLSRFFCDARRCYPVIGGVQVYGDVTHLTSAFARTLGPFLLDDVRRLAASWR